MKKTLTLAYSPCPNDTFIFYALANRLIDFGFEFKTFLADVETLNQAALQGIYDISKLSFAAFGHVRDNYALLRTGAALGKGCGPIIVAKPGFELKRLSATKIAVPGILTTAYLLLALYASDNGAGIPEVVPMPFNSIMPEVSKGDFEAGVIIHEGRFTYSAYNLSNILDLGKWWEEKTALPIPLGGIAIKRDSIHIAEKIEAGIRKSIEYAFKNQGSADEYIRNHAQEMDLSVIQQHIELYVNEFSHNLGHEGEAAINRLFEMAIQCGIIPKSNSSLFAK